MKYNNILSNIMNIKINDIHNNEALSINGLYIMLRSKKRIEYTVLVKLIRLLNAIYDDNEINKYEYDIINNSIVNKAIKYFNRDTVIRFLKNEVLYISQFNMNNLKIQHDITCNDLDFIDI